MTHRIIQLSRLAIVPALLALGAVSAPAASAGNPCFHGFELPPASVGGGSDIKLMPCAFEPTITQVARDAEVTFINGPDFTHLITGANQAWGSPDVEVQPNASVSYTFESAGIYPYACALHPGMSGAIVVGDVSEALAGVATGSIGAPKAGGSTGTSQGSTTSAGAEATSANATSEGASNTDAMPLVAIGIGAGLVGGAAAAWLSIRRRAPGGHSLVNAD